MNSLHFCLSDSVFTFSFTVEEQLNRIENSRLMFVPLVLYILNSTLLLLACLLKRNRLGL